MNEQTIAPEKLEFKTELKQLLHIITHSLYSNQQIFLRELISNASDALNKLKHDSLQHEEKLEGDKNWKIKLIPDAVKNTLTISDNGIGMSRDTIIDQLGTIAKSGTRAFLEALKQQKESVQPDLIGQFGVGFYSSYVVADKVTVRSRLAGDPPDQGVQWESDGQGEFTVEPLTKEKRGTDVVLHLKEDAKEFLAEWKLRQLVKKYANFLEHPVVMDVEKTEDDKKVTKEETLNSREAIWLSRKQDVKPEEYNDFYKQISHDGNDPLCVIHYSVEGVQDYKALLFIPAHRPFELQFNFGEQTIGPRLYVQRVQIMDNCEDLLPPYLRFVKGVVDSADLPLNISREILQHTRMLEAMQKEIVRSVLKELKWLMESDYDKYRQFFRELGSILKEGIGQDFANREAIADLLLVESIQTEAGKLTTLAKYVEAMPDEQKEIYYLTGESRGLLEHSPYLEVFRAKGHDVLLLTDPIDEIVVSSLREYKKKPLKAVDRGDLSEVENKVAEDKATKLKGLIEYLNGKLSEVKEVRLTNRLKESATCLIVPEGAMTSHVERLMRQMGHTEAAPERILELNPDHEAIVAMSELHEKQADDPRLEDYARLLYDEAVLAEGSKVLDPSRFAQRINAMIARDAKQ